MKSKIALFWFLVSLVLGALLAFEWKQHQQQQLKMEALQLDLEKFVQESRTATAQAEELRKERSSTQRELAAAQDQAARDRGSSSAAPVQSAQADTPRISSPNHVGAGEGGNPGNFLANLMKDPEARKAMREQQRMGLNMMYGSLFKQLQLSPEQDQKLKDMLLDQQMDNMSHAGDLMGAGGDRADAMKKIAEDQTQRQGEIKELLGDEKYAQFEQYSQTMGERMMLDQFGKDVDISPDQKEQVLAIVLEEKKNAQINAGAQFAKENKDFQNVIASTDAMERMIAQQEQVNERVLERAGSILSAEQVRKLEPVLKSQLDMQRAGAKMARQMFASPMPAESNSTK